MKEVPGSERGRTSQVGQSAGIDAIERLVRNGNLHLIDGQWAESVSGARFTTLDPATNEPWAEAAEGTAADVDRAVRAARRAFDEGPWPRMSPRERGRILRRLADEIDRRADAIGDVERLDTGLPVAQARGGQVPRAAENFRFFADAAEHLEERAFLQGSGYVNYTLRRPVGVAALITPWNTPFMLETWKMAPCLAAGNTCVLKPAEWSPASATLLGEIALAAGVPNGVVNIVQGLGETAGAALTVHGGVDLISFTGETVTGSEIVRAGAATLKRYSLELGGKSPVLIFADADLERALDSAAYGVFSLNGERCTAGSRVLAERSVYDRVVDGLVARAERIRVGSPADPLTGLGPLIHPAHLARVLDYVRIGRQEGARLATGGERVYGAEGEFARGNFMTPTVFADVTPAMRIAQEEIFGPVVCVLPFDGEADAIHRANDTRYGLAAYVWTGQPERAHRVAGRLHSGMVWVNSHNVRHLPTPFGGQKASGMGREGGAYSFDFYMETTNVSVPLAEHPIPSLWAPSEA